MRISDWSSDVCSSDLRFGGEPAMAQGPLGFLKLFAAWGAEVAVLIDWARRHGSGSVALGGVSLGALTSQLTAVAARDWPAELRPDALLLIASSQDLKEVAFNGSLATRSEEHTSELQSLMRISYAVFC